MSQSSTRWTSVTRDRIGDVLSALLTMSEWAQHGEATAEQTEMLLAPYREMLRALQEHDIPIAVLADESEPVQAQR
jgi:hypothetical protein